MAAPVRNSCPKLTVATSFNRITCPSIVLTAIWPISSNEVNWLGERIRYCSPDFSIYAAPTLLLLADKACITSRIDKPRICNSCSLGATTYCLT